MSRSKKIGILIIILGFIAGAYGAVSSMANNNDSSSSSGENVPFTVFSCEQSSIMQLSWNYSGADCTVMRDTADGLWYCPADLMLYVDSAKVSAMLGAVYSIQAQSSISPENDLSEYGLDPATVSVTATMFDGTSYSFKCGSFNSYTNSYYFSFSGSDLVYLVSDPMISEFSYKMEDMAVAEDTSDDTSDSSSQSSEEIITDGSSAEDSATAS